jgi:hypothetical protein
MHPHTRAELVVAPARPRSASFVRVRARRQDDLGALVLRLKRAFDLPIGVLSAKCAKRSRCDGGSTFAHRLADARPRDPAEMQGRDTAVAQIVRREEWDSGGAAGARD